MPDLAERVNATLLPPSRVAVLVVDVQNDFVHPAGKAGRSGADMRSLAAAVVEINRLIRAARTAGACVVYLRVEHGPDVDAAPYRARYLQRGMQVGDLLCQTGTWGAELDDRLVAPADDEPTFVKHAYDGFQVAGLEAFLRQRDVTTVLVTGLVTNLCVLATATGAFEHGFFVHVPPECTASTDTAAADQALRSIEQWYGDIPPMAMVLDAWQRWTTDRAAAPQAAGIA